MKFRDRFHAAALTFLDQNLHRCTTTDSIKGDIDFLVACDLLIDEIEVYVTRQLHESKEPHGSA